MKRPRILVVDDKPNFLALFRRILPTQDFELFTASDATEALALLARAPTDVVLSDVKMSGMDGIHLLRHIKAVYPDVEVILMTAFGAVPDAVSAMKSGAFHYLTKPFDPDDALDIIRKALAQRAVVPRYETPRLIAVSPRMQQALELISRAASSDAPALVTGEMGAGKELVARELHRRSARSGGPFLTFNCGAPIATLDESELLIGILREASGGILFLNEIVELPQSLQRKLLRIIQDRTIHEAEDVRIVTATSADVDEAVKDGRIREDLYYHLNVFSIYVPALRERREDIEPLATAFLEQCHRQNLRLTEEARRALIAYYWPGNVRQLVNVLERAATLTTIDEIDTGVLPEEIVGARSSNPSPDDLAQLPYREALAHSRDRASTEYLRALLKAVRGNVTQAAERAGMERESLHRLLKKFGLRAEDFRAK